MMAVWSWIYPFIHPPNFEEGYFLEVYETPPGACKGCFKHLLTPGRRIFTGFPLPVLAF